MRTPTPTECGYIAGYFDAEGSVGVRKSNDGGTWNVMVSFGQCYPPSLFLLMEVYGGGLRWVKAAKKRWRPQIHYQLRRSAMTLTFLKDILPYVAEKRDQVEAVLGRFSTRMDARGARQLRRDLKSMKEAEIRPKDLPPGAITNLVDGSKKTCSAYRCGRAARARGFCPLHYQRARASGELSSTRDALKRVPFSYRRIPSDEERAYFAGYFDGDGTLEIAARFKTWHLAVKFNQTMPQGILRMASVYGGSVKLRAARTKRRRRQLHYYLSQRGAMLQFLADIDPYAIEKRGELDLIRGTFDGANPDARAMKAALSIARELAMVRGPWEAAIDRLQPNKRKRITVVYERTERGWSVSTPSVAEAIGIGRTKKTARANLLTAIRKLQKDGDKWQTSSTPSGCWRRPESPAKSTWPS